MNFLPILAAAEAAQPPDNYFAGLIVALAVLAGACYLTGVLTKRSVLATLATMGPAAAPRPAPAGCPATQTESAQTLAPELVVVIAAAVSTVLGENYKVVAINPPDNNWGQAGRQAVLSSHRIR